MPLSTAPALLPKLVYRDTPAMPVPYGVPEVFKCAACNKEEIAHNFAIAFFTNTDGGGRKLEREQYAVQFIKTRHTTLF